MNEQESLARQFEPYRGPLRAVAYRMLGSLSEADDAVQEAWLRLSRTDISTVGSLEAWLRTVVARVCLDMLRARTSRREEPLGWAVTAPSQQDGPEQLDAASQTCQRALELTAVPGRPLSAAAGPAYVGLGEVACQRNELDIALRHVTEGITLCRQFVYTPPLAAGLATLAWIRQAAGDPACARDAMDQAVRAAPVPAGLLNPVPAQRARLQVAQGDLDAAVRWASENGLGADDEPDYPREPGHMVLARVQLARDLPVRHQVIDTDQPGWADEVPEADGPGLNSSGARTG